MYKPYEAIEQYVAKVYRVDKKNIKVDTIRDSISKKVTKANTILKFTFPYKGKQKVLYAKLNANDVKYQNASTVDLMFRMGALGFTIPKFHYIHSLYKYLKVNKNKKGIDHNVLITEDGLDVEDINNFKDNSETINISEDKAIDRLILQMKFGIGDNKTENLKTFRKYNDKNKEIFFDPTYFEVADVSRIYYLINYIKNYVNIPRDKITLKYINDNRINSYEAHVFRLFVNFLKEQAKENIKIKNQLDDENLTIDNLFKILKDNKLFDKGKNEEFIDFLLRKKYPNIENKEEREQKHFNKIAYYYNKNKDKFDTIKNKYYNDELNNFEKYISKFQSTYHPLFIGNNVDEEHKQSKEREYFNFKNTNTALDFKIDENDILEAEQLNREKRETAEDYYFSFDKEKFSGANIDDFKKIFRKKNNKINFINNINDIRKEFKEGEENEKNNRLIIQNVIVNSIISLSNSLGLTLEETSRIILASIDNKNYSNIKNNNDKKGKMFSAKFQQIMSNLGIYTGRKNSNIGLRLKRLPKSIVGELFENKDKFITKFQQQSLQNLSENLSNVNLDEGSQKLMDYYYNLH